MVQFHCVCPLSVFCVCRRLSCVFVHSLSSVCVRPLSSVYVRPLSSVCVSVLCLLCMSALCLLCMSALYLLCTSTLYLLCLFALFWIHDLFARLVFAVFWIHVLFALSVFGIFWIHDLFALSLTVSVSRNAMQKDWVYTKVKVSQHFDSSRQHWLSFNSWTVEFVHRETLYAAMSLSYKPTHEESGLLSVSAKVRVTGFISWKNDGPVSLLGLLTSLSVPVSTSSEIAQR